MQSSVSAGISLTGEIAVPLGGQMPDSVRSRFRESYQSSISGVVAPGCADFDEVLLELVGSVVNSKLTILHAVSLLMSINFTDSTQVMTALADSLWFWGTQVNMQKLFCLYFIYCIASCIFYYSYSFIIFPVMILAIPEKL